MRLFHLLTEDRVCLNCNQTLDKHMATGRCGGCELPHWPRAVGSPPCPECHFVYTHRDTCTGVGYLSHPAYPGSMPHTHPEGA